MSRTSKNVVAVVESDAAKEIEIASGRERARIGRQMIESATRAPFALPKSPEAVKTRLAELGASREDETAEMAALLNEAVRLDLPKTEGFKSVGEFAETRYGIGASKARGLVAAFRQFTELGLTPKLLGGRQGVSFNKFMTLMPAVRAEVVTPKNVAEWLPLLRREGPGALPQGRLKEEVTGAIVARAAADPAQSRVTLSISLARDTLVSATTMLSTLRQVASLPNDEAALMLALSAALGQYGTDFGAGAATIGLRTLREMGAAFGLVTPVYVAENDGATEHNVGTPVARSVFVRGEEACLAASRAEAAAMLGGAVTEARLTVAPSFLPPTTVQRRAAAERLAQAEQELAGDAIDAVGTPPDETSADVGASASVEAAPPTETPTETPALMLDAGTRVVVTAEDGGPERSGTVLRVENGVVRVSFGRGRPAEVPRHRVRAAAADEPAPLPAPEAPKRQRKASTAADVAPADAPVVPAEPTPVVAPESSDPTFTAETPGGLRSAIQQICLAMTAAGHVDAVRGVTATFAEKQAEFRDAGHAQPGLAAQLAIYPALVEAAKTHGLWAALVPELRRLT